MKRMPPKAARDNIKSQITFLPFLLFAALSFAFLIVLPAFDMSVLPHAPLRVDAASQQPNDGVLWQDVDEKSIPNAGTRLIIPQKYRTLHLNSDGFKKLLDSVPLEQPLGPRGVGVQIAMPMPDGKFARFLVVESPIVLGGPAHQFPGIKTYAGQGIDDPAATMRFDWTPQGLHVIVLSPQGTVYIDPYGSGTVSEYISYNAQDYTRDNPYGCLVTEAAGKAQGAIPSTLPSINNGTVLRTYRLAVATTGEYTAVAGGSANALSNITTAVNRVNAIYERDLSVRFMLISNESAIIFSDADTDPYTNSNPITMLGENQTALDSIVGSNNYDIGQVFETATFGVADYGVVCGGWKAHGVSAYFGPVDRFAVEMMSHEMGHQFGAHHSFNGTTNSCGSVGGIVSRNAGSAYEPGAGSTIMAYVYGCGNQSTQNLKDDYFSIGSLQDMLSFINGSSCAGQTSTGNTPPTVDAGGDFNIPKATPFTLTATGSDPNGDSVTYAWEEYDLGAQSPPDSDADGQARPIFRSRLPATSQTRTFPALNYILDSANVAPTNLFFGNGSIQFLTAESLPTMTRTMTFQVTARDNRSGGGGITSDTMLLNVTSTAGPFYVTEPNTAAVWTPGSHMVKWNVANTASPPVSCSYVRIKLSTDGGNTFPTLLADNVPNTGSATVSIPFVTTNTARIKVEAIGNIFFDVSDTNFVIPASGCTYSINPLTNSIPWNPGTTVYSFSVAGGKACTWQAKSNAPWITIISGSGIKNGTVTYVVLTNQNGASRTGTISLAGQLHTVTQAASGTCSYSVNPSTALFDQTGGTGRVDIGASTPDCNWTATSNASWIVVFSGSASLGNGIVLYSVAFNDTGSQRVGTLTVVGVTVTVTQSVPVSGGNNAISLNGSSAYADVASSSSLDITGAITVEAWINTNTTAPQQSILERYSFDGGGFALRLDGQNKVQFFTLANSGSGDVIQGVASIPTNGWHHVAGVFTGSLLRIYIDGNLDASKASTFAPAAGNSNLRIGARGDDTGFKFSGLIDEARLTAAAVYTANFTTQTCLSAVAGTRGLWKFDDQTANDSSGNNNNGTLVGNPGFAASQTCGAPTSYFSLSLNGSTAYVDVTSTTSLDITGAITVEAWINTNTTAPQQSILERYSFDGGGFALRLDGQNKVQFFTLANSGSGDVIQGVASIPTNGWHHVAGVFTGSLLRIYIDGNLDASKASTFAPAAGNSNLRIGARGDDTGFKFSGLIDEARLTAGAVYTTNFTPQSHLSPVTGTRGLWKFDTQTAADSSGNNNNGTLAGGATFSTNVP